MNLLKERKVYSTNANLGLIGCTTSVSRKRVRPTITRGDATAFRRREGKERREKKSTRKISPTVIHYAVPSIGYIPHVLTEQSSNKLQ